MSRRLRILHVYKDIWPPVYGGVEMHIHDVCLGLRDRFDFKILVAHDRATTIRTDLEGIPLVKAATWGRFASAPLCPTFPSLLARLARGADIVHHHLPNPTGVVSHLLMRPAAPAVVTYHSDIVRQQWALGVYGPFLRAFLRRAARIMPTSPRYVNTSPFLQGARERCRVVPLGIDLKAFEETAEIRAAAARIRAEHGDAPLIGFVGKLRAYKGLPYLVEAMGRVAPKARCLILGEGPMREPVEALIAELGLGDRVRLLGELPESEKAAFLYAIDVFCLPSHLRSEAFGLCMIEAMACGKPVVACDLDTDVPHVNRDGETGLIVPRADPEALAGALNRLIQSEELRRELGEGGRRSSRERFSAGRMLGEIAEVYEEVAGGGGG